MTTEILIIDDNAEIRLILQEILSDTGYKTRIAANYNQALKEIDKKLPDIAIIDVKLDKSDNDGIELLTEAPSKHSAFPNVAVQAPKKAPSSPPQEPAYAPKAATRLPLPDLNALNPIAVVHSVLPTLQPALFPMKTVSCMYPLPEPAWQAAQEPITTLHP